MIDKRHYRLRDLTIYYLPSAIFKSFLTGFIFWIFPSALLITLTYNIMLLYFYNLMFFLFGLLVALIALSYFGNKTIIRTLKNYGDRSEDLDYRNILIVLTVLSGLTIFSLFVIIFVFLF